MKPLSLTVSVNSIYIEFSVTRLPWDEDDEDEDDWVDQHLENRFAIYRSYVENRFRQQCH